MFDYGKWFRRIFGSRNERVIKGMLPLVTAVNALEPAYEELTDEALGVKTEEFRRRLTEGETVDDLLPEAFAVVREAAKRTLGLRLFDVQVLGGIVLHRGSIAEMMTGEGKTLTSVAPAYLNALPGNGVHIVTVNDYLARRDAAWNEPVYGLLGLKVGCIQAQMHSDERIPQYQADITYGTNSEFGFDYLRDNMKIRPEDQCQRSRPFAIIDEVDSILIDEARTPLIISGPAEEATDKYYLADRVVRRWKQGKRGVERADLDDLVEKAVPQPGPDRELERLRLEADYHFVYSDRDHTAYLTETGIVAAQEELGIPDFYAPEVMNQNWPHHLEQATRAHMLYEKEVDYVVRDGEVIIVDEFTGRLMEGRRWSDGLHQAVEAKEGIKIRKENQTLATITIQNFFKLYDKLAGMTGTALTEASEFHQIYKLDVVTVPTNRPLRRTNYDDRVFLSEKEKRTAVVEEILRVHHAGRPILVGTTSIEASEHLSSVLGKRGLPHEVLNAKHHEREAHIVAKAGELGMIVVSTNMAGRGTDILLDRFDFGELLEHWRRVGLAPKNARDDDPELWEKLGEHWAERFLTDKERAKLDGDPAARRRALVDYWTSVGHPILPDGPIGSVAELGGLHIIGTERHEARRIDNQLRGRAGRQGDPGSSVFFVSLEDTLMRRFAREGVKRLLSKLGMGDGQEITSPMVSRSIERAQRKVEQRNFDIRKNLLEYDQVNDEQRKAIYERRTALLRGEQLEETVWELVDTVIGSAVQRHLGRGQDPAEWTVGELVAWANRKFNLGEYGIELDPGELRATGGAEGAEEILRGAVRTAMERAREELGDEYFDLTMRFLLLSAFDDKWKEHLRELEAIRQAVGLRGYAQQDPKLEYKREAASMFTEMQTHIAEQVTDALLKVRVTDQTDDESLLGSRWRTTSLTHDEAAQFASSAEGAGTAPIGSTPDHIEPIRRDEPKVGRNDPCPCGSGKKYKKCCGRDA